MLFGIETFFHLSKSIQFSVPPVIRLPSSWQIRQVIRMCISNEIILNLVEFVIVFIELVFVFVDFGFDIEELIASFTSALSAVALVKGVITWC